MTDTDKNADGMTETDQLQGTESESYAEDTPLTWVFGNHPEPKLIAAYLSERNRDLNVTTVARIAGLSRSAVYNHLDELTEFGIVMETREMGGQLYQINKENEYAKILYEIEDQLLAEHLGSGEPVASERTLLDREDESDTAPDIEEPYADETPLTLVLGNHPEVKIIAALLSEHTQDINVTELSRIAGVSRNDGYDHLERLMRYDLVEQTRTMGNSKLYTIDSSKRSVQLIYKLENQLLVDHLEQKRTVHT